jgi:hypothetical protein
MKIILDDIEIFELLEKANVAGFDPGKPLVLDFTHEENWGLLIFNPSGELKGCRLFLILQQDLSSEAEKLLIPELLGLDDKHGYDRLKNRALAIVEHMLHERKSGQLYFDGH